MLSTTCPGVIAMSTPWNSASVNALRIAASNTLNGLTMRLSPREKTRPVFLKLTRGVSGVGQFARRAASGGSHEKAPGFRRHRLGAGKGATGARNTAMACARRAASPEGPIITGANPYMTISAVDFASLLCSRLCHDLLSPVGALNNGLELLADEHDPEMRQRCLELLAASAKASANKLKFFRLAFGAAGGFGETIDTREARAALEGLFAANNRVELGWLIEDPTLPKAGIKVLLNLALLAGDALIRGGQLDIGAEYI